MLDGLDAGAAVFVVVCEELTEKGVWRREHDAAAERVAQPVHRLVADAHGAVTQLLSDHRDQLDSLSHALIEAETLDAADAYAAAGVLMRATELHAEASAASLGSKR